MKESELETMRKSFKTVKDRSSKIKNSSSIKRLEKRVREIEKESIANKEELWTSCGDWSCTLALVILDYRNYIR